jgi:hypothetical protein
MRTYPDLFGVTAVRADPPEDLSESLIAPSGRPAW